VNQSKLIVNFSKLAPVFKLIGKNQKWTGFHIGITQNEFLEFDEIVNKQFYLNGWFTEKNVRSSLLAWSELLEKDKLENWSNKYTFNENPKKIGIIMAGNIPLVGFHDFLCVILSGNKAIVKLSSDDNTLLPAIIKLLGIFDEEILNKIEISQNKIGKIEAIIATGSNNSMHYFTQYFGKYPHLFRKNRTSIAIIKGNESKEELALLGADIFTYFGLGCRNVSQIFIPIDFNINLIFEALISYSEVVNHHKYANNYDYNKAIHLMNREEILDNGFVLFKASNELFSPLAMLFYHRYEDFNEVEDFISKNEENIQAVVGKDYIPFGKAQQPGLEDYADGIDTMKWLEKLAL
jgi:hypothetical protein